MISSQLRTSVLMLLLISSLNIFSQQKYYTFSELRGMRDFSGISHLFYRLYYYEGNYTYYSYSNNIYDLNLSNDSSKILLNDSGGESPYMSFAHPIKDYAFWNNDPDKFIYGGSIYGMESFAFLKRYDNAEINMPGNFLDYGTYKIQISGQEDSLLYAALPGLYKSTDGGINWEIVDSSLSKLLLSISPFNDQVVFALDQNGYLVKSKNGGVTFNLVDTLRSYYYSDVNKMVFDSDTVRMYKVSLIFENFSFGDYVFSVSSDGGDSWQKKNAFSKKVFISNNVSKSGEVYLAEGRDIYVSYDYGNSFSPYQEVDENIKGLYKQEGTDKVYAITNYNLYEVTKNSIAIVLSTPIDPSTLDYYPLQIGNKWIYSGNYRTYPNYSSISTYIRKITDKETLQNNKTYFKIEEYEQNGLLPTSTFYERIDSLNGRIYRYDLDSINTGREYLIDDLLAEVSDSLECYRFKHYLTPTVVEYLGDTTLFNDTVSYKRFSIPSFPTDYAYILAKNFGLINFSSNDDNRAYDFSLKGAFIKGQIYGDTTVTEIATKNYRPNEFLLRQNFPNPFNPSTVINYEISQSSFVKIKVYDVLGREIAIMVNEEKPAGKYSITFNGGNLSSGIYFYSITAGSFHQTKKMVLLK
jgi:Secretion system C-terminal sorting domain